MSEFLAESRSLSSHDAPPRQELIQLRYNAKARVRPQYWNERTMTWYERAYLPEILRGLAITTGIFLRMAAEYALQEMSQGKDEVMPFWRVVDPKSPLAKKLPCGPEFIVSQRAAESSN